MHAHPTWGRFTCAVPDMGADVRNALPVHPRTGLTAIGVIGDRPVWPVIGAADPPPADGAPPPESGDSGTDDTADLPDKGKDWQSEAAKWKEMARKHEATSRQNAAAAKRLAEMEDAQKSEVQRLTERAEAAERALNAAQVETVRAKVAAAKGVPLELLTGTDEDEINEIADKLLAFKGRAASSEPPPAAPPPDMDQGVRGRDNKGSVKSGWDLFEQRRGTKQPANS